MSAAEENGEQLREEEPQNQYTQQEEPDLYQTPDETAAAAGGESRSEASRFWLKLVKSTFATSRRVVLLRLLLLFITSGSGPTCSDHLLAANRPQEGLPALHFSLTRCNKLNR